MYSDSVTNYRAAIASLPPRNEASAGGIARIDKLLAHFHLGGKCHWRAKSLANILWKSEAALMLANNIHKAKADMSDYDKAVFTEMLIEVYSFCTDGLVKVGDNQEYIAAFREELIYAFLDPATRKTVKKRSGGEWFFNDEKKMFVDALTNTFIYRSGIGACEFANATWSVRNGTGLTARLARYGSFMDGDNNFNYRKLISIIQYAINVLSGKLSDTLFATERHRLTNIASVLNATEVMIRSAKPNHKAVAMITDGNEISIQYRVINISDGTVEYYWSNGKVDTTEYRIFGIKGNKKYIEFVAYTGDIDINTRTSLLNSYREYRSALYAMPA